MVKKIVILLVAGLIIIQFFRPTKNIAEGEQPNNIATVATVPDNVQSILKRSCMDCHSNNTVYPWYDRIQPVAWFLDHHVQEGKSEINFDEYATYNLRRKYHKMEEIVEQIKEDNMPIKGYTVMHKDAKLSDNDKQDLIQWAESVMSDMKEKYPADSLLRRR